MRVRALCAVFLLTALIPASGCGGGTVKNTPDDSFYQRTEGEGDEEIQQYNDRMGQIYEDAFDRLTDPNDYEEMEGKDIGDKLTRKVLGGYQRAYRVFRSLSPVIIICSVAAGVLTMVLATHNKKIKRFGLFGLIIAIPAVVLLIVFGIGIFNGIMLY